MPDNNLEGRVAIVTGGASGIGKAMAFRLAAHGARVVIADIQDAGEAYAAELPREALWVRTDVAVEEDIAALVATTLERCGRLDILCNNAGIDGEMGPIGELSAANFDRVISVNLRGTFLGLRHGIPAILAGGRGGSVINTASAAGLVGIPQMSAYCASKAGVLGLTRAAAIEYGPANVRVNAICPGMIETPLLRSLDHADLMIAAATAATPAGRLGSPEEVAHLAAFLAGDESAFMTGASLTIDGAYTAI